MRKLLRGDVPQRVSSGELFFSVLLSRSFLQVLILIFKLALKRGNKNYKKIYYENEIQNNLKFNFTFVWILEKNTSILKQLTQF